ncbi:hypothetical protein T484DRAFT_1783883 [Baffinella frigidus]|nr:hypothetical protein T484DRAFT_1783883 [Cryptophyta sp. CCMP2293]
MKDDGKFVDILGEYGKFVDILGEYGKFVDILGVSCDSGKTETLHAMGREQVID